MATDHIRYDILAQAALRGVVRTVLADAAKKGLPGEHHFKITFNTTAPGVRLSERMRARYPKDMTIVLQHQFWDLAVTEQAFEVGLSFGGVPERVAVPFEAVTAFYDPAVQFGFQFETIDGTAEPEADEGPTTAETWRRWRKRQPVSAPSPTTNGRKPCRSLRSGGCGPRAKARAAKWCGSTASARNSGAASGRRASLNGPDPCVLVIRRRNRRGEMRFLTLRQSQQCRSE